MGLLQVTGGGEAEWRGEWEAATGTVAAGDEEGTRRGKHRLHTKVVHVSFISIHFTSFL